MRYKTLRTRPIVMNIGLAEISEEDLAQLKRMCQIYTDSVERLFEAYTSEALKVFRETGELPEFESLIERVKND